MMIAAWRGQTDTVKLLIKNGALIDRKDSHGNTALSRAASQGHT